MNTISSQQLLNQIRTLNAELQAPIPIQSGETSQAGFGALLTDAIDQVNKSQLQSADMKSAFETGNSDASLAEVMISVQKADLSFRAMTEVRNKLVTAYQEIMNMPV
jgi:flagellar hook-basal body complex protein FliE